ncbi:PQ-loop domain-containing protein [Naegleria gruberi]|uniref:PQ-loop domain-containing protein n=1 Tax=Naegleria gruberi TaxID=5762 RepID=D2VVG4_NAEGR|nr:PQ-loop domain-containing protein [Naegleria gruberi]EFC39232.1 PQ-loop domain-containing protein [Naegleria gruberi]|eukprot:XP_002671976.1 PQ-loop domain-containing protein [Naegleria gruberi strain NEG-M]
MVHVNDFLLTNIIPSALTNLFETSSLTPNVTFMQTCVRFDPAGFEYVGWVWDIFGECVHEPREIASFAVGMISIGFWMCALLPQVIANFKNRDASSLSTGYLIQITLGDACSMTAGIMSGQLITQILLSAYFVLMDVVMIAQYFCFVVIPKIYRKVKSRKIQPEKNQEIANSQSELVNKEKVEVKCENSKQQETILKSSIWISILAILVLITFFTTSTMLSNNVENAQKMNQKTMRKLLHAINEGQEYSTTQQDHNSFTFPPNTPVSIVGFSLGCFCAILYMGSRLPQIFLNFRRKTCDGLSPIYFGIGILGNVCYCVSIWLYSSDSAYLMTRIPWLVESTVNIFLDIFIMWQFVYYNYLYKGKKPESKEVKNKKVEELKVVSAMSTVSDTSPKVNAPTNDDWSSSSTSASPKEQIV